MKYGQFEYDFYSLFPNFLIGELPSTLESVELCDSRPKSWSIEVSHDKMNWIVISSISNYEYFADYARQTFECHKFADFSLVFELTKKDHKKNPTSF